MVCLLGSRDVGFGHVVGGKGGSYCSKSEMREWNGRDGVVRQRSSVYMGFVLVWFSSVLSMAVIQLYSLSGLLLCS